jgi:hypothetical protein
VGFLERDFERDHLAEKINRTKMGQKIHCAVAGSQTVCMPASRHAARCYSAKFSNCMHAHPTPYPAELVVKSLGNP